MSDQPGDNSHHLVTFAPGELIFSQGDEGEQMYIIQQGKVELVLEDDDGDAVPLAVLDRGDFFGEMSVIEGTPRTATARSMGGCSLLPLRGALFTEMLQRNPEVTLRIMRKLCGRIRELQERLRDQSDGLETTFVDELAPTPPRPPPADVPLRARLVHASGVEIELPDVAEALVGRPDSSVGRVPEIDLTDLNEQRTVSRRHARLIKRGGKLFVVEEAGAVNGTLINDEDIESGVPFELHDGDRIAFGAVVFVLRFG